MPKEIYMNPFTDFGFKKLFGTEANKDLLISFLNELLPPNDKIKTLSYSKNEHFGKNSSARKAIFDLHCTNENGDKFIVELQKAKQNYFKDRSVYYSTFPIQEQAPKGDWDYKLKPVYSVGILDFVFEEDKLEQKVQHTVQLKDQDCQVFYDKLTYIYLEMPNFKLTENELVTNYDKWLYAFKNLATLQRIPKKLETNIFKRFFQAAKLGLLTEEETKAYEESVKDYRDLKNIIDTSFSDGEQIGLTKGEQIGLTKGEQIGLTKGEQIGLTKGEYKAKLEIAQNAILKGFDNNIIQELTGLDIPTIEQLRKA